MKKRLLACMLAGVMAVSALAGCGSTGNGGQEQSAAPEAESAENTEEAEAPAADNATEDNAEAETNNGEKTVITFWNGFTGSDRETLEALVKEYNETNDKNIEVQMDIMPWDSFYQKLATALPEKGRTSLPWRRKESVLMRIPELWRQSMIFILPVSWMKRLCRKR